MKQLVKAVFQPVIADCQKQFALDLFKNLKPKEKQELFEVIKILNEKNV